MSDAVMKPMADSVSGREIFSACQEMLAVSTPVGGWEDIAREALEAIAAAKKTSMKTPNTYAGGFDAGCDWASGVADRALAKLAPPPPSVSIDNGSRPQEAVPTEGPDGSVLADLEKAWEILAAIPAINDLGSQYQEDIQAAILTALRTTPQPADGCSSNEGAGK